MVEVTEFDKNLCPKVSVFAIWSTCFWPALYLDFHIFVSGNKEFSRGGLFYDTFEIVTEPAGLLLSNYVNVTPLTPSIRQKASYGVNELGILGSD